MDARQAIYIGLLIASVVIQSALAAFSWRQRSMPGASPFFWFLVSGLLTSITYFGLAIAPNPTVGYFWARLRFLGMSTLTVHFLLFVLGYVGHDVWLKRRYYLWLYALPALNQLIVWTNGWHHLFFADWQLDQYGALAAESSEFGVWHAIYSVYSYLMTVLSVGILWQRFTQIKGVYRRQIGLLLLGALVGILVSLPGTLGVTSPPFNSFPVGSIVIGLYFTWAVFRYGLLNLKPVAYDAVFRSINDMAIVLDHYNRIADLNPVALQMVDRTESEVIGQPASAVFAAYSQLADVLRNPTSGHIEIIVDRAGTTTFLDLRLSPLYDARGDLTGRIVLARDITERKCAEEALAERNRVLYLLHDTATDIGTELNLATLLHHILARAIELLDADRGGSIHIYDAGSKTLRREALNGLKGDHIQAIVEPGSGLTGRVYQSGQPLIVNDYAHWEGRHLTQVASPPSAVIGIPLLSRGRVLGVLAVAANSARRTFNHQDVQVATMFAAQAAIAIQNVQSYQRAQQEIEERRRAEESLQSSQSMLRALIDAQDDSVFLVKFDGTMLTVNDAAAARFNKRAEDLRGMNAWDLMSPEIAQARQAQGEKMVQSGKAVRFVDERDGIWFETTIYPVFDGQGVITQLAVVARDITERKQAEKQEVALAIEREKVKLIADFITMTAHEFRTPLSTVNMNLTLMDKIDDPQVRAQRLAIIKQQLKYVSDLINTMLKMTRLDSQIGLTLRPTGIATLIRDLETRYGPVADVLALDLTTEIAPDLPAVPANAPVLYDALACLVDNALSYTPEGGTITLRSYAEAGELIIEVEDTGEGISEDALPHVFDRFFRVDKARTTRGAGLGLSNVKRAIDLHLGHVEVRSVVDQGSTFQIRLPCD